MSDNKPFFLGYEPLKAAKKTAKRTVEKPLPPIEMEGEPIVPIIAPINFLKSVSSGANKKKTSGFEEIENPVFWESPNSRVYVVTTAASPRNGKGDLQEGLWIQLEKDLGCPIKVIYPFTHNLGNSIKETSLVLSTKIDLAQHIPPNSIVLSIGFSGLIALTKSTDLTVSGFYDYLYNDTYLYAPSIKSWVFPIEQSDKFWNKSGYKETFDAYFVEQQCKKIKQFKRPSRMFPDPVIIHVDDTEKFFAENDEAGEVCWDLETSGFGHTTKKVVCLTISFDGITGYFLLWNKVDPKTFNHFLRNKYQIGANLKFDCKFMHHLGVTNSRIDFDTMHAGHVLNEMRSNALKTHAFLFTPWGGYDDELEEYKKKYKLAAHDYSLIPVPILKPYAVMDVIVCFRVYQKMKQQLQNDTLAIKRRAPTLANYYYKEVIPSVNLYLKSELRGLDIDWERCREVEQIMLPMIAEAKEKAMTALTSALKKAKPKLDESVYTEKVSKVNLDSGTELGIFIDDELNWPAIELTKANVFKTGKVPMKEWVKLGFSEAAVLLEYGQIKATYNAFVGNEQKKTGMWKYKTDSGRIYPTFSVMMAKSGRNKSSGPNFQNFPKRSKYAELIRSMFKAPKGFVFGETDGAGLQLRIGASQSNDSVMREAFMTGGGDLHSITAHQVFCRKYPVYEIEFGGFKLTSLTPVKVFRNGVDEYLPLFKVLPTDKVTQLTLPDKSEVSVDLSGRLVPLLNEAQSFMTLDQFKSVYKVKPYKTLRDKAKSLNFSNEFGGSAMGLGLGLLHQEWTEAECDLFILEEGLKARLSKWASRQDMTSTNAKFVTCADRIIEIFFELYAGLKRWQIRNIEFAEYYGCIRSPFGARRLLPELLHPGYVDKENSRYFKNLRNITANSPVQNHEVVIIHRAMRDIDTDIVQHGGRSLLIGNVHDAVVGYYDKKELSSWLSKTIDQAFSFDHPENNGIPYSCESNFADPDQGEGWGFGRRNTEADEDYDFDFDFDEDDFES